MADLMNLCLLASASVRDIMECIDKNTRGIALVVDEDQHLIGTITDGDVRRAVLSGISLAGTAVDLLQRKKTTNYSQPVTATVGATQEELLRLMQSNVVQQIPILDEAGRVVDLVTWRDVLPERGGPIQAVIMAGGEGRRLRPLTEDIPKPMLSVKDRPIIEHAIDRLRDSGIARAWITTRYKAEAIKDHFGDGSSLGVQLNYFTEDEPLGTAGALASLVIEGGPILVVNGDILTDLDFRRMADFHWEHGASLTMAVREYDVSIPYGVVECDGVNVQAIGEKPTLKFFVSAGIYILEKEAIEMIPRDQRFDMVELIQLMVDREMVVVAFPVIEYWLDIGEHDKYHQAQSDARNGRFRS